MSLPKPAKDEPSTCRLGAVLPFPNKQCIPKRVKDEVDQWPSLQSINHPLQREKWLRETDAFFASQVRLLHQADASAVDAMLADLRDRLAALERHAGKSAPEAPLTDEERSAGLILQWETLVCGMETLDAICWAAPFTQSAREEYRYYDELRELTGRPLWNPNHPDLQRRIRAREYTAQEPAHITHIRDVLMAERKRLDDRYSILRSEGWANPAVPVKYFLQVANTLGIPIAMQKEMTAARRPTGEPFFV
ncbi:hypothetical protein FB451DRAFT_1409785 [Mycena latifolia]|nr:hypothetical protein FB451DRAFT_1409785 [Mycena latifolia]